MTFIANIARRLRRLAGGLKEKPSARLEEFEFEHFLLYHGLVGTSPENERAYRDVRADIREALKAGSSLQMSIALRLPPLMWEDKLETIFGELSATFGGDVLRCLLPESNREDPVDDARPLRHSDWRVRANAARVLAFLGAGEAVDQMVLALADDSEERKAAFCHVSYSLGRLGGARAREALIPFLAHEEPWFRVDAAGALASFSVEEAGEPLMAGMSLRHRLSDYMACAIARRHPPLVFLEAPDEKLRHGGLEMVLSLIQASRQTFSADPAVRAQLADCTAAVLRLAERQPSPRSLRAALELTRARGLAGSPEALLAERLASEKLGLAMDVLRTASGNGSAGIVAEPEILFGASSDATSETAHALWLVGDRGAADALSDVLAMLRPDNLWLDEAIECAGRLGQAEAATHLVSLARSLVDLPFRTSKPLSQQPVFEDSPVQARHYWNVLRALAGLPHQKSAEFLLEATADFAADKRHQALLSLNSVMGDGALSHLQDRLTAAVRERLADPNPQIRSAALQAVASHRLIVCLPQVVKAVEAKEVSVYRQAMETLVALSAEDGNARTVAGAVRQRLQGGMDRYMRERFERVLKEMSSA